MDLKNNFNALHIHVSTDEVLRIAKGREFQNKLPVPFGAIFISDDGN